MAARHEEKPLPALVMRVIPGAHGLACLAQPLAIRQRLDDGEISAHFAEIYGAPPRCIAPTSTAPTEAASRPSRSISQVTPYLGNRS